MDYNIEIAHIPGGNLGTIVLAGCYFPPRSYGMKIGLVECDLPLKWSVREEKSYPVFDHLSLAYPANPSASIFDLGPALTPTKIVRVVFSKSEEFANGTEKIFKSFDLKTVLRTILPDNGDVTVLQLMVQMHGESIGLTGQRKGDLYTSKIYDVIGGPLVEDKKKE